MGLAYVFISQLDQPWPQNTSSIWIGIGLKHNCGRHLGFVSVSYELTKPTEDKSGDDFKDAHTHTPAHNGCLIMIPITSWALTSWAWVCLIYYLHSF